MEIRPQVKHRGKTEIFASPQDGHLYDKNGKRLKEYTSGTDGLRYVMIDGLQYNVSRLCCMAFFPENPDWLVGHHDGNRANNRKSNIFWYGSEEARQFEEEMISTSFSSKTKIVILNDTTGEIIAEFPSCKKAGEFLGICKNAVTLRINNKSVIDNIRVKRVSSATNIEIKTDWKRTRRVKQLTMQGELINVYKSIVEAAETNEILQPGISNCLRGKAKSYKGFKWEYDDDFEQNQEDTTPKEQNQETITEKVQDTPQEPIIEDTIIEDPIKEEEPKQEVEESVENKVEEEPKPIVEKKMRGRKRRPICQCDRFTGKKIAEFESIADGARAVGCDVATLWDVLKGRYLNAKGFKWCYKEDYVEPTEPVKEDLKMEDIKDAPIEDLCKEVKNIPNKGDTMERNDYRILEIEHPKKRKVCCLDPDTRRVLCTFEAISYAARMFNVYLNQIWRALKYGKKLCGYYWEFK